MRSGSDSRISSTRALTPRVALILAAVMNFVGALLAPAVFHPGHRARSALRIVAASTGMSSG